MIIARDDTFPSNYEISVITFHLFETWQRNLDTFLLKLFYTRENRFTRKNKNISKKLKLRLKSTIIDTTLTYASETWILRKRDRQQINIFETKVCRRILDPVYDNEKENLWILTNKEIYAMVKKTHYNINSKVKQIMLVWAYAETGRQ